MVSPWVDKIAAYDASSFSKKVWRAMLRIPRGRVSTYSDVARAIGHPRASRAVGNACNINPFAPSVPCHRIVSGNGGLGGYALGLEKKIRLLKGEGVSVRRGKILDFDSVRYSFS